MAIRARARRGLAALAVTLCLLPAGVSQAATAAGVFYHEQSGTTHSDVAAAQAAHLASARLGFAVRLPRTWPHGSLLRALWVMDRHAPPFVVIYYGGDDGYITCQLHESLSATPAALSWAPQTAIHIGHTQGLMRRTAIGGANPVVELIWRARGVRYDLLGSTSTPLTTLMAMATTLL